MELLRVVAGRHDRRHIVCQLRRHAEAEAEGPSCDLSGVHVGALLQLYSCSSLRRAQSSRGDAGPGVGALTHAHARAQLRPSWHWCTCAHAPLRIRGSASSGSKMRALFPCCVGRIRQADTWLNPGSQRSAVLHWPGLARLGSRALWRSPSCMVDWTVADVADPGSLRHGR